MRNPSRIRPFMEWVTREWEASPDLRFGQFLINMGLVEDSMGLWQIDICDYDFTHTAIREFQTWGTFGNNKNLGDEHKQVLIKDLDTDHIKVILETQKHIFDTKIHKILIDELEFRKNE